MAKNIQHLSPIGSSRTGQKLNLYVVFMDRRMSAVAWVLFFFIRVGLETDARHRVKESLKYFRVPPSNLKIRRNFSDSEMCLKIILIIMIVNITMNQRSYITLYVFIEYLYRVGVGGGSHCFLYIR